MKRVRHSEHPIFPFSMIISFAREAPSWSWLLVLITT
jgi:hypothetical protein